VRKSFYCFFLVVSLVLTAQSLPSGKAKKRTTFSSTSVYSHYGILDANQIALWATDQGIIEHNLPNENAGVGFPPNSSTIVFGGGFLWGGMVNDGKRELKVGGHTEITGVRGGAILPGGFPENPSDVHIYRIRKDWKTADLSSEVSNLLGVSLPNVTQAEIDGLREQYHHDWVFWPASEGAPYYDRNGKLGYQPDTSGSAGPNTDEPGLGGADAVVWIVCNDLDTTLTQSFGGCNPIGLEEQITLWEYKSANLQNVVYERCRLIYKGTPQTPPGSTIDSMFMAKWSEPDIGSDANDYAGYDLTRNLGFCYSASDTDLQYQRYNMIPPAVGYRIVEGPRVPQPGATGTWNLTTIPGYANLPPSSCTVFDDNYLEIDSVNLLYFSEPATQQWFNILNGYRPRPFNIPTCFTNPYTNQCAAFQLTGDAVNQLGWVDGRQNVGGDRRMTISMGPFSMALGDTQEIVVALVAGQGSTNLLSIATMDSVSDQANDNFRLGFNGGLVIPTPDLQPVELDQSVILDWESDVAQLNRVESFSAAGYQFFTYKIYQFADSLGATGKYQFPPFDIGAPRSLRLTTDYLRNKPLVDGQRYYYAVTALMYNPNQGFADQYLESPLKIFTVVPHAPNPGTIYPYQVEQLVSNWTNEYGEDDAQITMQVIDPTKTDNHIYKLVFHRPDPLDFSQYDYIDSTLNDTLLHYSWVDGSVYRVPSRGITLSIADARFGVKGVVQTEEANKPSNVNVFDSPDPERKYMVTAGGFAHLDTLSGGTPNDYDIEWRFLGDSSWAMLMRGSIRSSGWTRVPYQAFQINPYTHVPRQIYTIITNQSQDSVWRTAQFFNESYHGHVLKEFYPVTFYADSQYISGNSYAAGRYDDHVAFDSANSIQALAAMWASIRQGKVISKASIWYAYLADLDGDGKPAAPNSIITFQRYKSITDLDAKVYHSRGVVTNNVAEAKTAIEQINAFPNPYYGFNRVEGSRTAKFITFNHLPYNATIRIFNLAGILVRTLHKSDPTQFTEWDLQNESALPVASGLYLAHMQLSDVHGTDLGGKSLKLMIVMEQQYFQSAAGQ
jgi:hypothetical protein